MGPLDLLYRFGIALGIGLLVGLQRQHAHRGRESEEETFAGVRTFPLLALLGSVGALLAAEAESPWPLIVLLTLAGTLIIAGYVIAAWRGSVGATTEVAALLTTVAGALCYYGRVGEAVALGVAIMAFLTLRVELHQLAGRITRDDFLATLKFGVITAVGINTLVGAGEDLMQPRNLVIVSLVLVSGVGGLRLGNEAYSLSGIGLAGLVGVFANLLLPRGRAG